MLTEEHFSCVFCVYTRGVLYRSGCAGKSPLGLLSLLSAASLCSCMGKGSKERCIWHSARGLVREPCHACTGQCARVPPGQALPASLDPGWGSGHSGSAPAHALGVDTARSGVTRHLHGCSLTWFEPVSAAGFASVQLSWFCFAAVIVFNSNAARHKEVVALFLLLSASALAL